MLFEVVDASARDVSFLSANPARGGALFAQRADLRVVERSRLQDEAGRAYEHIRLTETSPVPQTVRSAAPFAFPAANQWNSPSAPEAVPGLESQVPSEDHNDDPAENSALVEPVSEPRPETDQAARTTWLTAGPGGHAIVVEPVGSAARSGALPVETQSGTGSDRVPRSRQSPLPSHGWNSSADQAEELDPLYLVFDGKTITRLKSLSEAPAADVLPWREWRGLPSDVQVAETGGTEAGDGQGAVPAALFPTHGWNSPPVKDAEASSGTAGDSAAVLSPGPSAVTSPLGTAPDAPGWIRSRIRYLEEAEFFENNLAVHLIQLKEVNEEFGKMTRAAWRHAMSAGADLRLFGTSNAGQPGAVGNYWVDLARVANSGSLRERMAFMFEGLSSQLIPNLLGGPEQRPQKLMDQYEIRDHPANRAPDVWVRLEEAEARYTAAKRAVQSGRQDLIAHLPALKVAYQQAVEGVGTGIPVDDVRPPLSEAEREFIGGRETLPWVYATSYINMPLWVDLHPASEDTGGLVRTGISGSTYRFMHHAIRMNQQWGLNLDLGLVRLGVLSGQLPRPFRHETEVARGGHHTFHEVMLGAQIALDELPGHDPALDYADDLYRYRNIHPLTEDDLRENVARDGKFPDEHALEAWHENHTEALDQERDNQGWNSTPVQDAEASSGPNAVAGTYSTDLTAVADPDAPNPPAGSKPLTIVDSVAAVLFGAEPDLATERSDTPEDTSAGEGLFAGPMGSGEELSDQSLSVEDGAVVGAGLVFPRPSEGGLRATGLALEEFAARFGAYYGLPQWEQYSEEHEKGIGQVLAADPKVVQQARAAVG
ncbi:hypothetical protein ACI2L1_45070, partial [Streptomyces sp. NPDC019531]|uniref:hypothetical protein n=1 Tax=Streptomyces sp. NPDC019531 TaxID=3365062 RepID=UPI00385001FC